MAKGKMTVLLGLSGGVDSSVAAILLKNEGYDVIGAFMKNYSDSKNELTGDCAYKDERDMALRIAYLLDIKFVTLDFEDAYKSKVIDPMFRSYSKGQTPNPDIECNSIIKFPLLWKSAKKLKADYIATGHYARIKKTKRGYSLLKGKDKEKDQSYFLSGLTQDDLSHTLFPIGEYTKDEIRSIAKKNNFPNFNKRSTRGICFVGKTDIQDFLKQRIKEQYGTILSPEGIEIGSHNGSMFYTIGQKIGDNDKISLNKPRSLSQKRWYVAKKEKGNIIIAAPEGHPLLMQKMVRLKDFHRINPKVKLPLISLKARIRHRGELYSGKLLKKGKDWSFIFKSPVSSIASGQYLVIYDKDELIASGEIVL